jgi:uncharacterized protein (DUF2062 family)
MSLRSIFKRYLPAHHTIKEHRHLRHFGDLLHDPDLWHLTRRSTAGGVAIGLFCAFIPIPIQMFFAAGFAILLSVNLPLAVISVWISNPITFAPIFFFSYEVGTWLLNEPIKQIAFELSVQWLTESLVLIWKPLLLGCFILGTLSAILGYTIIIWLWRLTLVRKWNDRRARRLQQNKNS